MSRKQDYSKKILRTLGQKPAIPVTNLLLRAPLGTPSTKLDRYAITRSIKGLREAGLIENILSPRNEYARLTKEGKKKMHSLELENETTVANISWDGFWRIIILDLPENRKNERESLRYLLKKAGFMCLKNSVWISPHPYEYLFTNLKKDLGLRTEMMIIVTKFIDENTQKILFESFGK